MLQEPNKWWNSSAKVAWDCVGSRRIGSAAGGEVLLGAWAPVYCESSDRCEMDSEWHSGDHHDVTQVTHWVMLIREAHTRRNCCCVSETLRS